MQADQAHQVVGEDCGVNVNLEVRQASATVRRIAFLHHRVERQSATSGSQVDLVTVAGRATARDEDVGVRLERAHEFLTRWHRCTAEHSAFGLRAHPAQQVQMRPRARHPGLTLTPEGARCDRISSARRLALRP